MSIKDTLGEIEGILRNLKQNSRDERLLQHGEIVKLLSQVDTFEKESPAPNYKIYKQDLLTSVEKMCDLDRDDIQEGEHIGRSLLAVRKMASYSCFNVNQHYI